MNFLSKENPDRWHQLAWWLCVVTLPWLTVLNNVCIILLAIITITDRGFFTRWSRLRTARWAWPFFAYYTLLIVGLMYTADPNNGVSALDRKFSFAVLPFIAVMGRSLNEKMIRTLKLSFVYSCALIVLLSLILAFANFLSGGSAFNFDAGAAMNYSHLHPDASPFWMHFSYIQLSRWIDLHPAYFSMYLVFCLAILFTEKHYSTRQVIFHLFLGIAISGFIAMLSTRMAIVAFIITALYLGATAVGKGRLFYPLAVLGSAIVLGSLLWLNPVSRFRLVEEPMKTTYLADTSITQWNSVNYRLLEWRGSWSIIRDHLIFGVGTNGWRSAMDSFYSNFNASTIGLTYNSHNQFLQTWMENGILALITFLFCVFGFMLRSNIDQGHIAFMLIFSLMCLTESIIERQKGIVFFTLFQSLFLAFENRR